MLFIIPRLESQSNEFDYFLDLFVKVNREERQANYEVENCCQENIWAKSQILLHHSGPVSYFSNVGVKPQNIILCVSQKSRILVIFKS